MAAVVCWCVGGAGDVTSVDTFSVERAKHELEFSAAWKRGSSGRAASGSCSPGIAATLQGRT